MSTFDSTKLNLRDLLIEISAGKLQLPDFQRGWVWDDNHIRSLLVSIARSFPIGAVMLLETGGSLRFQVRPVEGVELPDGAEELAERLILDGQQRLTSLTQVLHLNQAVTTRDEKKRPLRLHYYIDIEAALGPPENLIEAFVAVDESRVRRTNFGRDIALDLSSTDKEIDAFHFPCSQIMESSEWEYALTSRAQAKFQHYMDFRKRVLEPFRNYSLPVISLKRNTSKEAVCLVFEKVNTGGVPLSVFELITASWAADGFNLREDWFGTEFQPGRHERLTEKTLLKDLQATDFLQGISLLASYATRKEKIQNGLTGKELPPVTAKREHILGMDLSAYQTWADSLTKGFMEVDRFLRHQGLHHPKFLPYRSQLAPLAALMAHIGERWHEPRIQKKLAQWYWCGVLGELYGGAVETRIANDFTQLLAWIADEADTAPVPATVLAANFSPSRIDTLRTRTSAAYRGLYILLQREGARDFFWQSRMVDLDRDELKIDIHHIFPKAWCSKQGIPPSTYNSIANKTAISYKANRMIGGRAPSKYLKQLEDKGVEKLNDILRTHHINPALLRKDQFKACYVARKEALLEVVVHAMGKSLPPADTDVSVNESESESPGGR